MIQPTPEEDFRVTCYPDRGKGGQHVGVSPGIKVEHLPSGTIAISQIARTQHANREIALDMIMSALTHPRFK